MTNKKPLYQQIQLDLLNKINSNIYKIGDRLPSELELSKLYSVSRITIKNALRQLSEDNIIIRYPGKGTFVNRPSNQNFFNSPIKTEQTIGLILSDLSPNNGLKILLSIEKNLSLSGYKLILKITDENRELEEKYLNELYGSNISGIIITPIQGEYYNKILLKTVLDNFPLVVIDRNLEGIPANFVGSDNLFSAKVATEELINNGHRNIGIITYSSFNNSVIKSRLDGINSAFECNNHLNCNKYLINTIESSYHSNKNSNVVENDIETIAKFIDNQSEITALFALDHHAAELAYLAIHRNGKNIPEDYSIICFDSPDLLLSGNQFSHIKQNEEKIGEEAVKLLLKQIKKSNIQNNKKIIPCEYIDCGTINNINY